MSFSRKSIIHLNKQTIRKEHPHKPQPFSKNSKTKSESKEFRLFQIGKLLQPPKSCKQLELSVNQKSNINQKVFTSDESNNQKAANMHISIDIDQNVSKNQNSHQPLNFKPKKFKVGGSKRQLKNSKIENLSSKLNKMNQLLRSQDQQLNQMKNSMSQRELHRLIKIHSIQKLRLLETIQMLKTTNSSKNMKK